MLRSTLLSVLICCTMVVQLNGQQASFEIPPTNSHAVVQQMVAATKIEVTYNRPSVKGRTIFGELIPFGRVWRTGSDASTKVTFSTAVSIVGQRLNAGTYELFTVPNKDTWQIIFQENRSQWGSYNYKPELDVARVSVPIEVLSRKVETFTISFDEITSSSAVLSLMWENTRVPIVISVDLKETVLPQLEASLEGTGQKPYFRAAMFYFENDLGIDRAAELMKLALDSNTGHIGMLYRYALILEKKGDITAAKEASQQSLDGAQKVQSIELKQEYTKLNKELLGRLRNRP